MVSHHSHSRNKPNLIWVLGLQTTRSSSPIAYMEKLNFVIEIALQFSSAMCMKEWLLFLVKRSCQMGLTWSLGVWENIGSAIWFSCFVLFVGGGRILTTTSMSLIVLGLFSSCISSQVTFSNVYCLWNLCILSKF